MNMKRLSPNDPQEWLNRAKSNLLRSQAQIEGVYLEDLCFDAQQAAEKAIKSILIYRKGRFPYIHDLGQLLVLVEESGVEIPNSILEAAAYSVRSCYALSRSNRASFRRGICTGCGHS
jgi:HEPN domain-containing protein